MSLENNNECKIVQDLMPSYVENLLSVESKNLVDKHIQNCVNCKSFLKKMNNNIKINSHDTNLEVDYLKKYRRRMIVLKSILLIIFIIIVSFGVYKISKYKYNENVINKVISKYEEINSMNNFYIEKKSIYIDYKNNTSKQFFNEIYYKDGMYKRVGDSYIAYGQVNSNDYTEIFHNTKTIEDRVSNEIPVLKNELLYIMPMYEYPKEKNAQNFYLNSISIKTAKYNNKECYVITTFKDKTGYREYWVDKETNLIIKQISKSEGMYYREELFTIILNQVKDGDVQMDNLEQYADYTRKNVTINVNDNIIKEWREQNS